MEGNQWVSENPIDDHSKFINRWLKNEREEEKKRINLGEEKGQYMERWEIWY